MATSVVGLGTWGLSWDGHTANGRVDSPGCLARVPFGDAILSPGALSSNIPFACRHFSLMFQVCCFCLTTSSAFIVIYRRNLQLQGPRFVLLAIPAVERRIFLFFSTFSMCNPAPECEMTNRILLDTRTVFALCIHGHIIYVRVYGWYVRPFLPTVCIAYLLRKDGVDRRTDA